MRTCVKCNQLLPKDMFKRKKLQNTWFNSKCLVCLPQKAVVKTGMKTSVEFLDMLKFLYKKELDKNSRDQVNTIIEAYIENLIPISPDQFDHIQSLYLKYS